MVKDLTKEEYKAAKSIIENGKDLVRQIYRNRERISEDPTLCKNTLCGIHEMMAILEGMVAHIGQERIIEIPVLREQALSDVEKVVVRIQAGMRDEKKDN